MLRRASVLAVVALMIGAVGARAQDNIELGVDWAFGVNADGDTQWFVDIPASQFRAGFWFSDRFSIEPRLGYDLRSNGGTDHLLDLGLNGLVFLSKSVERVRGYFQGYPASSPQIALFREGRLEHMLERKDIEGKTAEAIAADLRAAFDRCCAPAA